MGLRILLVGSGGREHALAWKILESPLCDRLLVAPGNPGIEALARGASGAGRVACVAVSAENVADLLELVSRERIGLVVCGPEGPLVAGLADGCAARGTPCFGPSRAAAQIEGSKAFAKSIMREAGVPTAAYGSFEDVRAAEAFIDAQPGDVVVKADGLCAGKGVVVTSSHDEAKAAVRRMLGERQFGDAGARVVVEERLAGRECSLMALTDGERFAMLASAEDHKTVFDGDRGPNTGGMGAYSPSPLLDDAQVARIGETIFAPTLRALSAAGCRFRGLLYGGLMLTPDRGPMVIEFNCRFGDPETQAVLPRLSGDLVPWLLGAAGGTLPPGELSFRPGLALCTVLAAAGYPGKVRTGDVISGLGDDGQVTSEGVTVFHGATRRDGGELVTAGGRVLGVAATGVNLADARARVYEAIEDIQFSGVHFRKDIGLRGDNT